MDSNDIKDIENTAKENYKKSEPWPDDDIWHSYTYKILHKHIQDYIDELQFENTQVVLNAGCGKTTYKTCATTILESKKFYQKNNSSIWIYGIFKLPHLRKIQTPRKELFHV